MEQFIVIFRKHGELNMETKYYGPMSFCDAYEFSCTLPALDFCPAGDNPGVKWIEQLIYPTNAVTA